MTSDMNERLLARFATEVFRSKERFAEEQKDLVKFSKVCVPYLVRYLEQAEPDTRNLIEYRYSQHPPLSYDCCGLNLHITRQAVGLRMKQIRKRAWEYICFTRYGLDAPTEALGLPNVRRNSRFCREKMTIRELTAKSREELAADYKIPPVAMECLEQKLRSLGVTLR